MSSVGGKRVEMAIKSVKASNLSPLNFLSQFPFSTDDTATTAAA